MQVKEYLENYNLINSELARLQAELNVLIKEKAGTYDTIKAYKMTGMPKGNSGVKDPVYDTVEHLIDGYDKKITFYAKRINEIINEKALFDSIWTDLSILSGEEHAMVSLRYFDRFPWAKIAIKMSYCEKHCFRLLKKAVEKLQAKVDDSS